MATEGLPLVERGLSVPAEAASLSLLHDQLGFFWAAVERAQPGAVDAHWRAYFETAVGEIATNIVRHAYAPGTLARPMRLHLRLFETAIEACFVDHGEPNRPRVATAPPSDALADLAEGGYGMALARAAVDELSYTRTPAGTNVWTLVKRL